DRRRRQAELAEPAGELLRRRDIDDAAEAHPSMGCGAHGAVLPGGVDGGGGALVWTHVRCRPTGEGELRVPRGIPPGDPVAVLGEDTAISGDEYGAEGLVTGLQSLGGEFDATPQMILVHRSINV